MAVDSLEELFELVRRELGAGDARLLGEGEARPDAPEAVVHELADGRALLATFREAPFDADAMRGRLALLADTFATVLDRARTRPSRPPPELGLHEELVLLAERAGALDAIVIDAQSPVVWGAADERSLELGPAPDVPSNVHWLDPSAAPPPPAPREPAASASALDRVRALPEMPTLRKGGHVSFGVVEGDVGVVAKSFAGIYVLVLVFAGAHDELRARHALGQALPRIERLVLALPPRNPGPTAVGGVAVRRRPKR